MLAEEKQSRPTTDVLFAIVFRTPAGVCAKCKSAAKNLLLLPLTTLPNGSSSSESHLPSKQSQRYKSIPTVPCNLLHTNQRSLSLSSRKEQIPKLNNYDLITAHQYGLQFTPRNPSNTTGPNYTFFNRSKFYFQERLRVKDFPTSYKIQILTDSLTMTSIRADRTLLFFNFQFRTKKSIEITTIISFF